MKERLKHIKSKGCTNICDGIITCANLMKKSKCSSKRMWVFSDGLINEGIIEPDKIYLNIQKIHNNYNININTFGIGKSIRLKYILVNEKISFIKLKQKNNANIITKIIKSNTNKYKTKIMTFFSVIESDKNIDTDS